MLKRSCLVIVLLCLFCSPVSVNSCESSRQLAINIESPKNGDIVRSNIIKVQGSLTDNSATVKINGVIANLVNDNHFAVFTQLHEGNNLITVSANTRDNEVEQTLEIDFIPAVSVFLNSPRLTQTIDSAISIGGYVYPNQASVYINNSPVQVNSNGAFSSQIVLVEGNNIITANASFFGSYDSSKYTILVENGKPIIPPGQGLSEIVQWVLPESISIKQKQSMTVGTSLFLGKRLLNIPQQTLLERIPVANEYSDELKPLPSEMTINLTPSKIDVYPNTTYYIDINIDTKEDILPGEYWILLQVNNDEIRIWLKIIVS
jgi:hypothetical protein